MNKKDNLFLGTSSIKLMMWKLALPAIIAQVINMLYNLVDRIYIGHIKDVGSISLTGVGICFPIIILVAAFASLVAMGSAPRASIEMGKNNNKKAEKILGNSFILLLIVAFVITICLIIFNKYLLRLFGASDNTIGYASAYLRIYSVGTVFVMMSVGMNAFISSQGFTKVAMHTTLIGAILNIVLDPVFIFVFDLGVKGAALATIFSQFVSSIWVLYFLTKGDSILKIKKKNFKLDKKIMGPCLALGLAPFIMNSTESALLIVFNSSLLKYGGDLAVGAMTILSSIIQLIRLPIFGFSQGAQPIISYNYGAQNKQRVKESIKMLFKVEVIYTMSVFIIIEMFPILFITIFTNDSLLIAECLWSLRIFALASGIFGVQNAVQMSLVSMGQAKVSVSIAVLRKLILLIPLIFILPYFFTDKVFAIILAEPVADFISVLYAAIIFYFVLKRELRKMK